MPKDKQKLNTHTTRDSAPDPEYRIKMPSSNLKKNTSLKNQETKKKK